MLDGIGGEKRPAPASIRRANAMKERDKNALKESLTVMGMTLLIMAGAALYRILIVALFDNLIEAVAGALVGIIIGCGIYVFFDSRKFYERENQGRD